MSSSDLPKLLTEPTKIGHILRKKKYFQNQSFQKNFIYRKKKSERFVWFLMPKKDFESTSFANFEEVVHNFGGSDDDMI